MKKVTIDFETRSLVQFVKGKTAQTSQDRYAEDPSTEVLFLAVKCGKQRTRWWAPSWVTEAFSDNILFPDRINEERLTELASNPDIVFEAHNAPFEIAIWDHIMHRRLGLPNIPVERWRCSAAKAATHGLPRGLAGATEAMGLPIQKDQGGHALMMQMCKPLTPLKQQYVDLAEKLDLPLAAVRAMCASKDMKDRWFSGEHDKELVRWKDDKDSLIRLGEYCIQDVDAEHALSTRLHDIPEREQKVWVLDQKINGRGLPVDLEACKAFIEFTQLAQKKLAKQFKEATDGVVDTPKCNVAFANWLRANGVECKGVAKPEVERMLGLSSLPPNCRTALELAFKANKSSVAKYDALLRGVSSDGRIRGTMLYHGASTGREAGKLFQPQNLPRGDFSAIDLCIQMVKARMFEEVEALFGDAMHVASTCIRGMVSLWEKHEEDFICADYSAVEGRVLAWLAGEDTTLDIYREGKNPYCAVASDCFGVPYQEIFDGYENGDAEMTDLRHKGKTGDLACGFGGGQGAVLRFAKGMPKSDRIDLVKRWRESHPKTKKFWYDLSGAAANAMQQPGRAFTVGKLAYMYDKSYGFLMCKLPSGRKLYYANPELIVSDIGPGAEARKALVTPGVKFRFSDMTIWADDMDRIHLKSDGEDVRIFPRESIGVSPLWEKRDNKVVRAWTVDADTKKWAQRDLSHLILSENGTQAVARDLLIQCAFVNLEEAGYPVILQVHDEAMAQVKKGFGSVEEFEQLMCNLPSWADGLPIAAKGWRGNRFKK